MLDELVKEISDTDSRHQRSPTTDTLQAVVASENTQLFPLYAKLGFRLTGEEAPVLVEHFGPLIPGFEHTTLKTISREFKPFK